ncbi:MAG: hypothetical protein WC120_05395 [Parcubacteria group bacterium]|jgi:hypothetical protein
MARKWTFGTNSFGSLVTAAAPHLLDSGQLQVAENVNRDVAGQVSPSKADTVVHQMTENINGMKALRYGGATHVFCADENYVYEDGVSIGESGGNTAHRFFTDSERVYILNGHANSVWDGTTFRKFGPLGSGRVGTSTAPIAAVFKEPGSGTPAGLTGAYKWALSYRVTLESGQVIESQLYSTDSVTLVSTDGAMVYYKTITQATVDAWCADLGTGKVEGVIWRTKSAGVDYWQQSVIPQATIVGVNALLFVYDEVVDADLGAEYLDADNAHGTPPEAADLAVFCQRRLFLAVKGSRTLYFSGIDQYDYFAPLASVNCEESIEGLDALGESVAVATPTSIRLWSPVDATGQWSNSASSAGTTFADGLASTDFGLLFARLDGLYLFDGNSSVRISAAIDPTWQQYSSYVVAWHGAYANGMGFYTNGIIAVEFKYLGGKFEWSTSSFVQSNVAIGIVCADPTDNGLWAVNASGQIVRLHLGASLNTMTIKTKDFGDGNVRHWDRITVDFSGSLTATILTNRGSTQTCALSSTDRLQDRKMLLATMIGELCNVTLVGTGTAHRVELETT